ncbi:ABC transporter ATP-binding protein [Bordetella sputigena]|uniref:ABC transporter ATP-binding protein n=1 Tax=Bordetella sputigena TaxID=1416810 RepID=UPI0039EF6612
MSQTPLLELRDLQVAYGGIRAVRGVNLVVNPGELVCLIGANGAGKSSTLRAICGLIPVAGGQVLYQGAPIQGRRSHELVREGLVMVPEGRGIFGQLTIEENLAMGAYVRRDAAGIRADLDKVFEQFPRLAERRKQAAGTLSGGEQQMVALGRAMIARPKLLLLDEPSMGLAPLMVEKVFEVVSAIASEGVTILLIEQNARLALEYSQRGYVMESGELTLSGPARSFLNDPKVRAAYLGELETV